MANKLGLTQSDIQLKLNTFTFNGVEMGEAEINRNGQTISIPTAADDPDKSLELGYFIDDNYETFKFLLKWYSANSAESIIKDDDTDYGTSLFLTNTKLILLGSYKKPKLEIEFKNTWIKNLGTFDFSYENPEVDLKSTMTLKYQQYKFNFLDEASL
jgi:hypothetical protein